MQVVIRELHRNTYSVQYCSNTVRIPPKWLYMNEPPRRWGVMQWDEPREVGTGDLPTVVWLLVYSAGSGTPFLLPACPHWRYHAEIRI